MINLFSKALISSNQVFVNFAQSVMIKFGGNSNVDLIDDASSLSKFGKLKHESMCDLKSFNKNSFPQQMHFCFNDVVLNTSYQIGITDNDLWISHI